MMHASRLSSLCSDNKRRITSGVRAYMRLVQLDSATSLDDLKLPPSNRLEPLIGDRAGQHSIRVNNRWRICFVWLGSDATDVEIVDYH